MMKKCVVSLVMVAVVAAAGSPDAARAFGSRKTPLDKTWTTRGQENEAGSQVLVLSALTSPVSFQAEGMGLEPTTGLTGT